MASCTFQYPFFSQFSNLCGECASLHAQIIGKSLPVIGDGKFVAVFDLCLRHQIRDQFVSRGALRHYFNFLLEKQIFGGYDAKQVVDELLVKDTGVGTGGENALAVNQHNFAGTFCNDTDRHELHIGTGKGLCKKLRRADNGDDASVPVEIILYDLDGAGQDKTDVCGFASLLKDGFVFRECERSGIETAKHRR